MMGKNGQFYGQSSEYKQRRLWQGTSEFTSMSKAPIRDSNLNI